MVRPAAIPTPVVPNELEIAVVGSHLRLAALQLLHGTLVHHERAGSGGSRECLLPARVYHVHIPRISLEGDAAQGANGVHNQEAVVRLGDGTHTLNLLHGPRGGLALAQEQGLGLVLLHRSLQLSEGVGLAGGLLQCHHLQAVTIGQVADAGTPDAIVSHQDLLTRLQHVRDGRLHGHVPGARDRAGVLAVRLEEVPQVIGNLVHDLKERGVHVTEHGHGHRSQRTGVRVGRARTHQDALGHIHHGRRLGHIRRGGERTERDALRLGAPQNLVECHAKRHGVNYAR
mmetsp:Transcript_11557/g.24210  ORF Transcript_11557/g.24210 Transcript_11557/m.24210 type:complete len:286 (-) Transcript_11557:48-905(-)